jgi:3-phenylpropionate/trans-cinnamate dioxygenase ferredoxin reductase subunit
MHIVILGNGVAGISAACRIRQQSDLPITVVSDESDYFFSRTALMYVFMGQMRHSDLYPYPKTFWHQNNIQLLRARVKKLDIHNKSLFTEDGQTLSYDQLILATGSSPVFPTNVPGAQIKGVQCLYHLKDLQTMELASQNIKQAVVAGGGLIGIEMAEMLHSRGIPVTFLVRENSYMDYLLPPEESELVNRHIRSMGINLLLNSSLASIADDGTASASGVYTQNGDFYTAQFVGIAFGVSPNVHLARQSPLEVNRGFLVNEYLETNIQGVFAVGDCAELRKPPSGRKALESTWYNARMMGEAVAENILGHSIPYHPGVPFNSAKFFDVAYQTYGEVPVGPSKEISAVFYASPCGKKSIRIAWNKSNGAVSGFLLMGIRYRQAVCEKWIQARTPIEKVLSQLALANFDGEGSRQFENALVEVYNRQSGRRVNPDSKRKLDSVLRFLKSPF